MGLTLLHNAHIVDANVDIPHGYLLIENGFIHEIGEGECVHHLPLDEVTDCNGMLLMPGVIDEHVHFRQPGMEHKADIAVESRAAARGGVTTFFDMPNTVPPTVTIEAWQQKMDIASVSSAINYAFLLGATPDNIDLLQQADYRNIPGVKLFMGATTGATATAGDDFMEKLFKNVKALIAVHAEDEATIAKNREKIAADFPELPVKCHSMIRDNAACLNATQKVIEVAERHNHRLHVMHISTADELGLLKAGNVDVKPITAETCPQYLFFDDKDYERLGARIKCNPSIKGSRDRKALIEALKSGKIDTVATDHAPHLIDEKQGNALSAVSGMPGVQFSLPLMLQLAKENNISFQHISALMSGNAARIWNIDRRGFIKTGYHADLVCIGTSDTPLTITDDIVESRCGWTPYTGFKTCFKVAWTLVNGVKVFDGAGILPTNAAMAVEFNH